jgi:ABC-2 type transport system ATP-binding protein
LHGNGRAPRALELLSDLLGDRVEREGEKLRITSDRGAHVLIEVLRLLGGDGMEPDTLMVREPSLDDVFLALTGRHADEESVEDGDEQGDV